MIKYCLYLNIIDIYSCFRSLLVWETMQSPTMSNSKICPQCFSHKSACISMVFQTLIKLWLVCETTMSWQVYYCAVYSCLCEQFSNWNCTSHPTLFNIIHHANKTYKFTFKVTQSLFLGNTKHVHFSRVFSGKHTHCKDHLLHDGWVMHRSGWSCNCCLAILCPVRFVIRVSVWMWISLSAAHYVFTGSLLHSFFPL